MRALRRFLRFLLRIQGVVIEGMESHDFPDSVSMQIRRRGNAKPRCPECRWVLGGRLATRRRSWRHLNLFRVKCYLVADLREGTCPRHGRRVERVPWAAPAARHTHEFDRQVASLVQVADKSAAERMFHVSWGTVGRMVERVVNALLPQDRLAGLRAISIDETSHKRGHRYLTVVSCVQTGRVVWISEGKSADSLRPFFAELGNERCARLEVVAMDMNGGYRKAVEEAAPHADIVYDRFHVVQLLLQAIDEVRREECRALRGDDRKSLKHTRFSLLRNPKHRTPPRRNGINPKPSSFQIRLFPLQGSRLGKRSWSSIGYNARQSR